MKYSGGKSTVRSKDQSGESSGIGSYSFNHPIQEPSEKIKIAHVTGIQLQDTNKSVSKNDML